MKLYYHPASTTSRTIMLFASEASIPLEYEVVDITLMDPAKNGARSSLERWTAERAKSRRGLAAE